MLNFVSLIRPRVDLVKYEWAFCTCHREPRRPIKRAAGSNDEWMHASTEDFATTIHVHVETYGTDCDGAHGYNYVRTPDDDQDDFDFWESVVAGMVHAYVEMGGTLTVSADVDKSGHKVAHWSHPHDEGHSSEDARRCFDPHDVDETSYVYDQFAQMMGY